MILKQGFQIILVKESNPRAHGLSIAVNSKHSDLYKPLSQFLIVTMIMVVAQGLS